MKFAATEPTEGDDVRSGFGDSGINAERLRKLSKGNPVNLSVQSCPGLTKRNGGKYLRILE